MGKATTSANVWRWPHMLSPLADLLYGSLPAPTFQLPDGRLQPDFLMDTFPDALFFGVSLGIVGALDSYCQYAKAPWEFRVSCMTPVLVHWVLFLMHALPRRSEKFFDLAGQLGFCAMLAYSYSTRTIGTARSGVICFLVSLWSFRLGYFLFSRMIERGEDFRFTRARLHPGFHFFTWTSQGLWVAFQGQAILALHHYCSLDPVTVPRLGTVFDYLGLIVWATGLSIEAIADFQKLAFVRLHPDRSKRKWIDEGLWRYSRHPNHLGESMVWVGISLLCFSGVGSTPDETTRLLFAPIFSVVFLMQTTVPWLDILADKKYIGEPGYVEYVRSVSKYMLLPRRPTWL
jgi:steroid 5-alpha reductase family enzyme